MRPSRLVFEALGHADGPAGCDALARHTGLTVTQVGEALGTLERRGFIEGLESGWQHTKSGHRAYRTMALRDASLPREKPVLRPVPLRQKAWAALRKLHKATLVDLAQLAGENTGTDPNRNIRKYLKQLRAFGIARPLRRRVPNTRPSRPGYQKWILVKDLGPAAPQMHRGRLYDPNSGEFIEKPTEEDAS